MERLSYIKTGVYTLVPSMIVGYMFGSITGLGWMMGIFVLPSLLCIALPIWKIIKPQFDRAKANEQSAPVDLKARRFGKAVYAFYGLGGILIVVGAILSHFGSALGLSLVGMGILAFFCVSVMTILLGHVFHLSKWKQNRGKKPSVSLKRRIKMMKPVMKTTDGHIITRTNKFSILFLSFVAWLAFLFIGNSVLKLNSVDSFYLAVAGGTGVMILLFVNYLMRRRNREIVKWVAPPRIGKHYFITAGIVFTVFLTFMLWGILPWLGTVLGLGLMGIVYLRNRKKWHQDKWKGTPTKFKMKKGTFTKSAGNFDKGFRI